VGTVGSQASVPLPTPRPYPGGVSAVKISRPRLAPLAGLVVALLLASVATLGLHCAAGAVETATVVESGHAAHHGSPAHLPHADATTDPEPQSGSSGLIALCVSVAVAILLAWARMALPQGIDVRAPMIKLRAALPNLAWPSPDPVRLCVLRT
jgi:hypothetical protein